MTSPPALPQRVEFGIVGGGIIGLALAYELASRDRGVVVFDDARRAGNATHAAAGMVAAAAESEIEHAGFIELRRLSRALYPEFVKRVEADSGVDCAFRTRGTILVALDRDQSVEIARLREIVSEQGFDTVALSGREVLELEPNLSGRVVEGLRLPHDFHIDQRRFMQALRRAAKRSGALVTTDATVERVDTGGRVSGRRGDAASAERFDVRCDQVVVAAGSWTSVDLRLPFEPLPVRPVRGQVVRLQADDVLRHVVRTPDVYLVPHADGELVVGASVEEQGFDANPTAGAVLDLLRHAWRALPALYDAPLHEIAVGFRPTARDHLPIIGRLRGCTAVATGHYRNGILLAPGTARLLAQLLCEDFEHELLRWFDPQRFAVQGALQAPHPA
jgi:glycine oxidase